MKRTLDPPYQSPMHAIEAELALWQGRPDTARAAVAAGLQQLSAEDHWLAAPLLWLGLWAEADAAVHAGGRRVTSERAMIEACGTALVVRGRGLLGRSPILAPMTQAYLRLSEAEGVRLFGHSASGLGASDNDIETPRSSLPRSLRALASRRGSAGGPPCSRRHTGVEPGPRDSLGNWCSALLNEVLLLASRARVELPTRAPSRCPGRAGKTGRGRHGRHRAHGASKGGPSVGLRRDDQSRDSSGALYLREDRRGARLEHPGCARRAEPSGGRHRGSPSGLGVDAGN